MIAATALRMDNAYPYKIHRPNRLKENNVRYLKKNVTAQQSDECVLSIFVYVIYIIFFFVCLFIIRFDAPRFLLLLFFFFVLFNYRYLFF